MSESLLVLNAGSSSVKYAIYGIAGADLCMIVKGQIENIGDSAHYSPHSHSNTYISSQFYRCFSVHLLYYLRQEFISLLSIIVVVPV